MKTDDNESTTEVGCEEDEPDRDKVLSLGTCRNFSSATVPHGFLASTFETGVSRENLKRNSKQNRYLNHWKDFVHYDMR